MYSWIDATWNPVKGECPHKCGYCYMKRFPVGELRFDEKCLKDDLGKGRTIFVGSNCDMWAEDVPWRWIEKALVYCRDKYPGNTYLFQTKNPDRYFDPGRFFRELEYPDDTILGVTIETNRENGHTGGAGMAKRYEAMERLGKYYKCMISIEPIMDFDLDELVKWVRNIQPSFVSIGADSSRNGLPEPPADKLLDLVSALERFTEVRQKNNLKRLLV